MESNEQIINGIVMQKLDLENNQVKPESVLTSDLGCDSLDLIELVMAMEKEFDIEIQDDKIEQLKTVKNLYEIVN